MQARNGQTFWDPTAAPSSFAVTLPDPLRVKPNGLQPHQPGVYEDFSTFKPVVAYGFNTLRSGMDSKRAAAASRPSSTTSFTPALYAPSPAPEPQYLNHQDAMERFGVRLQF